MKFSDVTPMDIAVLALAAVLCFVIYAAGGTVASLIPAFLAVTVLCFLRRQRDRRFFQNTRPALAKVVNYHVETRKEHRRNGTGREYQVWAPVVEFETENGIAKADYPVFSEQHWFRIGQTYEICYCPDVPAYFYFTERKRERVEYADGSLLVCLIFDAAYVVMLIAVFAGT